MSLTAKQKRYQKKRREEKRAAGLCVDCQKNAPKPQPHPWKRPHVCCESCLQARRARWHEGTMPPLFQQIQKSEQVH